jgi:hypothetical protein
MWGGDVRRLGECTPRNVVCSPFLLRCVRQLLTARVDVTAVIPPVRGRSLQFGARIGDNRRDVGTGWLSSVL